MLKPAIEYKKQIEYILSHLPETITEYLIINKDHYVPIKISSTNHITEQFVSVDRNNNIIGYFGYIHLDKTKRIKNLIIINFTENITIFAKDFLALLDMLFIERDFHTLSFSTKATNPANKTYFMYALKYQGEYIQREDGAYNFTFYKNGYINKRHKRV